MKKLILAATMVAAAIGAHATNQRYYVVAYIEVPGETHPRLVIEPRGVGIEDCMRGGKAIYEELKAAGVKHHITYGCQPMSKDVQIDRAIQK